MTGNAAVVRYDEIDADWLTAALTASGTLAGGARVVDAQRETCGTGQLADSFRFRLRYEPDGAGPETVVGKFPSDDAASRDFGQRSGYYRNEIRFYEEIAPTLSIAVPTPLHAALAANETDFVLLMEDLSPARVVDQIEGASADEAARVLEQIAAVHAGTWGRADLAQVAWLKGTSTSFTAVSDGFGDLIAGFADTYGDLIPAGDVAEAGRLIDHLDAWKAILNEPRCLWHSDLRADNVLFDAVGGRWPVALLDWQGVGFGPGVSDVSYFLGTSLDAETRRGHERDLVGVYHGALVAGGVEGYSAEQCWEEYRLLAAFPLQVGVFGLGAVRRSERGDRMWRNWIERSATQTRDLESFALLAARS